MNLDPDMGICPMMTPLMKDWDIDNSPQRSIQLVKPQVFSPSSPIKSICWFRFGPKRAIVALVSKCLLMVGDSGRIERSFTSWTFFSPDDENVFRTLIIDSLVLFVATGSSGFWTFRRRFSEFSSLIEQMPLVKIFHYWIEIGIHNLTFYETIFLMSWHPTGSIISYVLTIAMIVKKFAVIRQDIEKSSIGRIIRAAKDWPSLIGYEPKWHLEIHNRRFLSYGLDTKGLRVCQVYLISNS